MGKESIFVRIYDKGKAFAEFCWSGVWKRSDDTWKTRIIKTISLSIRSFLDRGLQMKSAGLTYSTVLAIVPVFALLFAIGRGFGFQKILEQELYAFLPAQHQAIDVVMKFIDPYLAQSSQGIFVGIGLIMLLWTLISLLSTIEDAFNNIWDVRRDRSMYQKITDYIAICLIIPILMVCQAGVSIFMSTVIQTKLHIAFLTPVLNTALELTPLALAWLAFTLSFFLIPNTKVNFKYAAISGAICAVAYQVVQLLFVNGQIYVTKFNAIYGSFAFLPLLLVWLQLSWLILLFGCVLTYSMQNVVAFNFLGDVKEVSHDYTRKVALVAVSAVARRFVEQKTPYTLSEISADFDLPIRLLNRIFHQLMKEKLVYRVLLADDKYGVSPAFNPDIYTAAQLFETLDRVGYDDFIPHFNARYKDIVALTDKWNADAWKDASSLLLKNISLPANPQ